MSNRCGDTNMGGGENVFKDVNLTSVLNTTALDKDEKCAYVLMRA